MTQRNATSEFLDEIAKSSVRMFHLFKGEFDDGTLYLTDAAHTISYDGNDYIGLGYLVTYDTIEEEADLQTTGVNITLSGVPVEMIALTINQDLADKPISIYRGFFDENGDIVTDPLLIFLGRSDGGNFNESIDDEYGEPDGKAVISLVAVNHWVDFEKVNGRRTNHKEQLNHFPGDEFFSFVADLVDKVVTWK